ncbi:MAG: class I SAM-dependent methyltransferase [Saccharofermentanales bacterium]
MDNIEIVEEFYNNGVQHEWERLDRHPIEFKVTAHFIDKYIKPGDRVLDIGGGPGRYSLYLASRGCDVTLLDLSEANVKLAELKAIEQNLSIHCYSGDARYADKIIDGKFDAILLMGPMYHLLDESDRILAVKSSMKLLRDGGTLFISFISIYAGVCYAMKCMPSLVLDQNEKEYMDCFFENRTYCGDAFTKACFIAPCDIIPFMNKFSIQKLHLIGQESITSPCEDRIITQSNEILDKWTEIAIRTCEREEFLAFSEHLMYIGVKQPEEKALDL